ncbi:MAG TPA: DUF721 domain-containing protein [Thermoleophilaceae bacterium]|nr:DUF721 domain-containing protein [Thermoleophilaceae bacterium]
MRRRAPRPLGTVLSETTQRLAPATPLARIRQAWPAVAGDRVTDQAEPVAERDGVVTVACRSAVWANELELLSGDLVQGFSAAMEGPDRAPTVRRLRFVVQSDAGAS